MRPEQTEQLFVETLISQSIEQNKIAEGKIGAIEKLAGDASTRRYYRVATSCESFVVCLDEPILEDNREHEFIRVQKALSQNGVRVPKIYDVDTKKGYILEEDLGDVTLLKELASISSVEEEYAMYQPCIDLLLKMHHLNLEKYPSETFNKLSFDQEKLMSEVQFSIKHFINKFMKTTLSPNEEAILLSIFSELCGNLAARPRLFTHRDFHSRNIMVKNKEFVAIDFQDARQGIPQYDLCSVLDDCYYFLNEQNVDKLKRYYWDNLTNKNSYNKSFADFLEIYDMMAIQRVFKAIGSFSYIYSLRGDVRYIKHIGHSFEKLKKILFKYPRFFAMRSLLANIYYEH